MLGFLEELERSSPVELQVVIELVLVYIRPMIMLMNSSIIASKPPPKSAKVASPSGCDCLTATWHHSSQGIAILRSVGVLHIFRWKKFFTAGVGLSKAWPIDHS